VRLRAVEIRTRPSGSFEVFSPFLDIERGGSATQLAATAAYEAAGIGPEDVDLAQLQDTESGAEIMHMAECGFCQDGDQEKWLLRDPRGLAENCPSIPTEGCLACGEPIGASGLRQVYENCRATEWGRGSAAGGRFAEDSLLPRLRRAGSFSRDNSRALTWTSNSQRETGHFAGKSETFLEANLTDSLKSSAKATTGVFAGASR